MHLHTLNVHILEHSCPTLVIAYNHDNNNNLPQWIPAIFLCPHKLESVKYCTLHCELFVADAEQWKSYTRNISPSV